MQFITAKIQQLMMNLEKISKLKFLQMMLIRILLGIVMKSLENKQKKRQKLQTELVLGDLSKKPCVSGLKNMLFLVIHWMKHIESF